MLVKNNGLCDLTLSSADGNFTVPGRVDETNEVPGQLEIPDAVLNKLIESPVVSHYFNSGVLVTAKPTVDPVVEAQAKVDAAKEAVSKASKADAAARQAELDAAVEELAKLTG